MLYCVLATSVKVFQKMCWRYIIFFLNFLGKALGCAKSYQISYSFRYCEQNTRIQNKK